MRIREFKAPADYLADRVILVTGAGQGLGEAAARQLAVAGATIILHGRRTDKLERVYDAIEAAGHAPPTLLPLDLNTADDTAFASAAHLIHDEFGRLDGIVHAASHLDTLSPLDMQTAVQMTTTFKVNLIAPFALTRYCLPLLQASNDASVVMVSETHAARPGAFWGGFALSKQALEGLVRIFSEELERCPQLRFNSLTPGPMHSPQRLRSHPGESKSLLPTPDTIAAALVWLMGPASRAVRAQHLTPDSEY